MPYECGRWGVGCGLRRVAYLQELVILMPVIICFAYFWCSFVQTRRVNKRMMANMSEGPLTFLWALEIPPCAHGGFVWVCGPRGILKRWHLTPSNVSTQVIAGAHDQTPTFFFHTNVINWQVLTWLLIREPENRGDSSGKERGWSICFQFYLRAKPIGATIAKMCTGLCALPEENAGMKRRFNGKKQSLMRQINNRLIKQRKWGGGGLYQEAEDDGKEQMLWSQIWMIVVAREIVVEIHASSCMQGCSTVVANEGIWDVRGGTGLWGFRLNNIISLWLCILCMRFFFVWELRLIC